MMAFQSLVSILSVSNIGIGNNVYEVFVSNKKDKGKFYFDASFHSNFYDNADKKSSVCSLRP